MFLNRYLFGVALFANILLNVTSLDYNCVSDTFGTSDTAQVFEFQVKSPPNVVYVPQVCMQNVGVTAEVCSVDEDNHTVAVPNLNQVYVSSKKPVTLNLKVYCDENPSTEQDQVNPNNAEAIQGEASAEEDEEQQEVPNSTEDEDQQGAPTDTEPEEQKKYQTESEAKLQQDFLKVTEARVPQGLALVPKINGQRTLTANQATAQLRVPTVMETKVQQGSPPVAPEIEVMGPQGLRLVNEARLLEELTPVLKPKYVEDDTQAVVAKVLQEVAKVNEGANLAQENINRVRFNAIRAQQKVNKAQNGVEKAQEHVAKALLGGGKAQFRVYEAEHSISKAQRRIQKAQNRIYNAQKRARKAQHNVDKAKKRAEKAEKNFVVSYIHGADYY